MFPLLRNSFDNLRSFLSARKRVIKIAVDEAGGKPIITGTGAPSTRVTVELTKSAKDAGADAAMIVTPYYLIPNEEELISIIKPLLKM